MFQRFLCVLVLANAFSANGFAQSVSAIEPVIKLISLGSTYQAMAWSRNGEHFMLAELFSTDGRVHYCVYKTETLKKIKCIAALPKDDEMYVGSLDWAGNRLYFEAGYIEEPSVGWIDISGWRKEKFKEIDASTKWEFVQGRHGVCPAWDEIEGGLFFGSTVEFGGVLFEKNKVQTVRLQTGDCAGFDADHIWYKEIGEDASGIRRLHRATGKVDVITNQGREFDDNPFSVSAKGRVLFVRRRNAIGGRYMVYGYSQATGIVGPLFGHKLPSGKDARAVVINKAGDRALVSVHDAKNSEDGKNRQTIFMLKLNWSEEQK